MSSFLFSDRRRAIRQGIIFAFSSPEAASKKRRGKPRLESEEKSRQLVPGRSLHRILSADADHVRRTVPQNRLAGGIGAMAGVRHGLHIRELRRFR
jgi:hypothetical protein